MLKLNLKHIISTILISVVLVPIIFFILLSINFGFPNIELKYGVLATTKLGHSSKFKTYGLFNPLTNTITIDINSSRSKFEILRTIYHEYGHYVYRHLDAEDKTKWKKDFCKKEGREGYKQFQLCSEEFSDGFVDYLLHRMDTKEEWNYFENVTKKYLT